MRRYYVVTVKFKVKAKSKVDAELKVEDAINARDGIDYEVLHDETRRVDEIPAIKKEDLTGWANYPEDW